MKAQRRQEFKKNIKLENLLRRLNDLLGPVEEQVLEDFVMPKYPVVLLVGCARSGTTLLMQWLARTGQFAYPTNLLSRFYQAPYLGALIQQLLTNPDYDFRDEFQGFANEVSFNSNLGKTKGPLSPNEFWYFWRRFIPNSESWYLDQESLNQIDASKFAAELAAVESVFDKPLAMKGLILELNLPFLSDILDKVLFLYIRRNPLYNSQSLLESRIRFFADRRAWYSFKPREYPALRDLEPIDQVAGQVYFTNQAIEEGLSQIEPGRWLAVSYEDFCAAPGRVFDQLKIKLAQQGYDGLGEYTGPASFQSTNQVRLPWPDWEQIASAYERFSELEIEP